MKNKKILYQVLFFVISIVFVYILVKQFGKLTDVVGTLAKGAWYLLVAVIGIQAIGVINRGAFYHSLYDYFGVGDSLKRLIKLSMASNFIVSESTKRKY